MGLLRDSNKRKYIDSSMNSSRMLESQSSQGYLGCHNSRRSFLNSLVFSSHGVNSQASNVEDTGKLKKELELSCILEDSPISKPIESQISYVKNIEEALDNLESDLDKPEDIDELQPGESLMSPSTIGSDRSNGQ